MRLDAMRFIQNGKINEDNSNLFWDDANNRLGIGTSSPTSALDVSGNAKVTSLNSTGDAVINTLTVGLGGGSFAGNTVLGTNALANNVGGARNTAIGNNALFANTHNDNTAVGADALGSSLYDGDQNTAVGSQTLQANTSGEQNVALGNSALQFNTTGIRNIAIGVGALGNITTGTTNVAIGNGATASQSNDSNSIIIGTFVTGAGSNKAVIGNSSINDVFFGSSSASANIHSKKLFLGSSSVPGCIIMGDSAGGVGYVTLDNGVITVSSTPPTACQ